MISMPDTSVEQPSSAQYRGPQCPLLALFGHPTCTDECPFSGVKAQGIEQINAAIAQMDKVSQSNSASAEESASAAEELDAQAETLKDLVAKLRLLVGGKSDTGSPTPVYPARLLPKITPAITSTGRRAILMPEDSMTKAESDNRNFQNL
jgi:hypothetical protein